MVHTIDAVHLLCYTAVTSSERACLPFEPLEILRYPDKGEQMSKDPTGNQPRTVRETGAQYIVNADGQRIAVLLSIQEYEHYLDLLDDEADSQDAELAARLAQASSQPTGGERQPFRDYLHQRGVDDASLQG
jgi:PHD/YefM family antitoxin component YafN of YafNO toxin-antitoxin module